MCVCSTRTTGNVNLNMNFKLNGTAAGGGTLALKLRGSLPVRLLVPLPQSNLNCTAQRKDFTEQGGYGLDIFEVGHTRQPRFVEPAGLLQHGPLSPHRSRCSKSKRRITAQTRRHENDVAHDTREGGKLDIRASAGQEQRSCNCRRSRQGF